MISSDPDQTGNQFSDAALVVGKLERPHGVSMTVFELIGMKRITPSERLLGIQDQGPFIMLNDKVRLENVVWSRMHRDTPAVLFLHACQVDQDVNKITTGISVSVVDGKIIAIEFQLGVGKYACQTGFKRSNEVNHTHFEVVCGFFLFKYNLFYGSKCRANPIHPIA
jgi:hypothetical protein